MTATIPYPLLHALRACLDGTADQPTWVACRDELDDLLLAEPGASPVLSAAVAMTTEKGAGR